MCTRASCSSRRLPLDRLAAEPEQPLLPLRVLARRVQARERRIGQEVDSASRRPASRPSPHSPASAAARSHVGSWSSSGGSGASRVHRRDVPVEPQRVRLGGEPALGERRLEAAVLRQQRGGGLGADAARAGDLVRGIAAQRDEVGHLLRVDAVALAHLGRPDPRQRARRPSAAAGSSSARSRAETCRGRRSRRAPSRREPPRTRPRRRGSRPPRSRPPSRPRSPSPRRAAAPGRAGRAAPRRTRARTGTRASASCR